MDKERLVELVENFGETAIFVIGDVGLDEYTDGTVDRLSPECPVPILCPNHSWEKLGLAGNVAENIVTLCGEAHLFSVVGQDAVGRKIHDLCDHKGIIPYFEQDPSRPSTSKHRIMCGHHQFIRIDQESTSQISVDYVLHCLHAFEIALLGEEEPIVIIQDYGKGLITPALYTSIADRCKKAGLKLLIDPSQKRSANYYKDCFLLTPNLKEAEALASTSIQTNDDIVKAGKIILEKTSAEFCVITRGEKGMSIIQKEIPEHIYIPTYAKSVFDVSGAGDTLIATMALALGAGATISEAAVLGNICAGIVVGKVGTAIVDQNELLTVLSVIEPSHLG